MSTPELASSYAALILADDGVDITVSFAAAANDLSLSSSRVASRILCFNMVC